MQFQKTRNSNTHWEKIKRHMGLDSTYYPSEETKRADLEEFLVILGYTKFHAPQHLKENKATYFHFFSKTPYESLQGVTFKVMIDDSQKLIACGRNNVLRSKHDNFFHNYSLKHLRKRFGGYFYSDYGKNRYFPFGGIDRKQADSGCYIAVRSAINRLHKISSVNMELNNWKTPLKKGDMSWINQYHPEVILGNLAIAHILSTLETYFKNTYIALLTYSEKKTEIIKLQNIRADDIISLVNKTIDFEEAYANSLNFQNAKLICQNFDRLDQNLCIRQALNKNHGRNKETFFGFIERVSEQRHSYLHHGEELWEYDMKSFAKDTSFCEFLIKDIYKNITERMGWHYEKPY
jgi:hypothetical protein